MFVHGYMRWIPTDSKKKLSFSWAQNLFIFIFCFRGKTWNFGCRLSEQVCEGKILLRRTEQNNWVTDVEAERLRVCLLQSIGGEQGTSAERQSAEQRAKGMHFGGVCCSVGNENDRWEETAMRKRWQKRWYVLSPTWCDFAPSEQSSDQPWCYVKPPPNKKPHSSQYKPPWDS